jgi:hypothetical protein
VPKVAKPKEDKSEAPVKKPRGRPAKKAAGMDNAQPKAPVKDGTVAVKTPKKDTVRGQSGKGAAELTESILKFMEAGKTYSSREIVEGLGREPGQKGGGPVVNCLTRLMSDGKVVGEKKPNGYVWTKAKRVKAVKPVV